MDPPAANPVPTRAERADNDENMPRPLLLIEGPRFPSFDFARSGLGANRFTIAGRPIYLFEHTNEVAQELVGEEHTVRTAEAIWDCGIILAKYLEKHSTALHLPNKRAIELGSGQSLPGLTCSLLGAEVTLTDTPSVLPTISRTVNLNGLPARVLSLDWLSRDTHLPAILCSAPYDLVLCADVVWVEWLIAPLIGTIAAIVTDPRQLVLFAHQTRSTRADETLFAELTKHDFEWEAMPRKELMEGFWKEQVVIYEIRRKEK